jgi:hypothetical protein
MAILKTYLSSTKLIQKGGEGMKTNYQIWLTWGISCLFAMLPCGGYGATLTIGDNVSVTGIDGTSIDAGSPVYIDNSGRLGTVTSPGTITVNCSATPPQFLQDAINAAQTGDTINVSGTCNQNVIIKEEKYGLTLDGQNTATINGTDSNNATINVRGRMITIQNFTITGGQLGISINRGGTATIKHNDISGGASANNGAINVISHSEAIIINNNIHDNAGLGILVQETSTARIGFNGGSDPSASPNIIQHNQGRGIEVNRGSSARIVGNTISNNQSDGIGVTRLSEADIADNTINENNGNGINVAHNSFVNLGEDNPTAFYQQPNSTTSDNTGYGLSCSLGAAVRGHLGSANPINGTLGPSSINNTCPNSLSTP